MVDVMAPVIDNIEEEGSTSRLRRARYRKFSPRGTLTQDVDPATKPVRRRIRYPRSERVRRDDDSSDESGSDESGESGDEGEHKGRKNQHTTSAAVSAIPSSTTSLLQTTPILSVSRSLSSTPAPTLVLSSPTSPTVLATPTTPTSLAPVSTLGPLPTVSDPAVVVANPQQVPELTAVPSGVPTSSTVGSADLPAFTLSSNPRKGEDSGTTATSLVSTILSSTQTSPTGTAESSPAAAFDTIPSPTIFVDDTGDLDGDGNRDHDNHHDAPPGGLSPTAEDVLISAGSIGAFILICFVVWVGWRALKKSKRPMEGSQYGQDPSPNNLLAKIPYFGRNQKGWQDLDGPMDQYDAKSMYSQSSTYSANDPRHVSQTMSTRGMPMTLPELQTNFTYSVAGHPYSASTMQGMIQPTSAQSMHSITTLQQQQAMHLPQLQTNFGPSMMANNPFASPQDGSNPSTLSPQAAAQYSAAMMGSGTMGSGTMGNGTMETFESLTSDRSRMPDAYFNQSELARQASTAYDPAKRAVYRASELSSISSGFGDGDFIIPAPPAAALQPQGGESRPISYAKSAPRSRSNSTVNGNGQRDTVYTTTSEDLPARYRSVNSWVNQQTGRVQRQQARDDDSDVPPVPSLPAEERYTMMMDDGEVPRRYEDTLSSQPPVPALPQNRNNPFADPSGRK